ncbi:MAG: hypothetical protein DHS20C21_04060 [Gemmatimonadota bacterium]|nr:MAG: hypothetical protein DHS20C21_04060 [Gemmatimonadota bacterium]
MIKTLPPPLKILLTGLLVVVVAMAGVGVGLLVRGFLGRDAPEQFVIQRSVTSLLQDDQTFPDVAVVAPAGTLRTSELARPHGCVFLFLDLQCPPCVDMAVKWQEALDSQSIEELRVVGITNHSADVIQRFRESHGLHFPVAEDSARVFLHDHRVERFPLEVVVGESGRIRSLRYNSGEPIDLARVAADLAS